MTFDETIIRGSQVKRLLIGLKANQSLLKIQFQGLEAPILSVIDQIDDTADESDCFYLDLPEQLPRSTTLPSKHTAHFEFKGSEKQYYSFKSSVKITPNGMVAVRLPDMIRRIQRRHNFRVQVPHKTKIRLNIEGQRLDLNVVDLSLGGTLALFARIETAKQPYSWLAVGDTLDNLEIVFPVQKTVLRIPIRKARIVRLEKGLRIHKYRYAFEFIQLDTQSKKHLTQIIYDLQRSFLRNRLKPDA
jgi:c-di-GMP-binding flagellar brake protein YcgR